MTRHILFVCAVAFSVVTVRGNSQSLPDLSQQYRSAGVVFSYPGGWESQENNGIAIIAPAGAHRRLSDGRSWITVGLIAGLYHTQESNLQTATDALVNRIIQANPELRPISAIREISVDGRPALIRDYSNAATQDGIYSRDLILTVKVPDGVRFWQMGWPADETETYAPMFESLVRSIHFEPQPAESRGMGATAPGHFYAEPSVSLVRETIQIRAGYAQHYDLPLQRGSKLVAKFRVQGGLNNRVNVLLLDSANYQRYLARQQFSTFSGTAGAVNGIGMYQFLVPSTDRYQLLIDNGKAWFMPRNVTLYVYSVLPGTTPESEEEERLLATAYSSLKTAFIFPDFGISIRHCGFENAFSNPNVTVCTELIEDLGDRKLAGALNFVLFHELGHTLLRLWGLPSWDNEDVADEFATVMLVMAHEQSGAMQAAQWWASKVSIKEAFGKLYTDDRHSVSPQRARNILHWLNNQNELVRRWQRELIPNMQTPILLASLKTGDLNHELVTRELRGRGVSVPQLRTAQ